MQIPTSIRLKDQTGERLKRFFESNPYISKVAFIDFACACLLDNLEGGAEIRITKDGLKLASPHKQGAEQA